MKTHYLEFEQPVAQADATVAALRATENADPKAITAAQNVAEQLAKDIYAKLSPWQTSQVSRHPQRPYTLDYIEHLFTDFRELHGDRSFADDPALVCGLARFEGKACVVIGHQKGRDVKERTFRNFGMPKPEGYRKAKRIMLLAEKFNLPIFTFVDTPGAYPGIGAEERGQSEAIGHNLYVMAQLKVPLICTVIGEGGSGGALAIAVGDAVLMLQHATYSVISPEGCASILWKNASKAPEAAAAMGLTSNRIKALGLIDKIVNEPAGGAHRDWPAMSKSLKKALIESVKELKNLSADELIERRHERLLSYGKFTEQALPASDAAALN